MPEYKNYAIIIEDKQGNIRFLGGFGEKSTYEDSLDESRKVEARIVFARFGINHAEYQYFIQNIGKVHGRNANEAQNDLKSLTDKLKE